MTTSSTQYFRGYTLIELIFFIAVVGGLLCGMGYMKWGKDFSMTPSSHEGAATSTDTSRVIASSTEAIATSTAPIPVITIHSPQGGEEFKLGTTTVLSWSSISNRFDYVSIQVVTNQIEDCPYGYTTDPSKQTCRAYEIYSGKNTGTTTWVVGKTLSDISIPQGVYYVRMWPDIGMETSHELVAEGFKTQTYSSTTFMILK